MSRLFGRIWRVMVSIIIIFLVVWTMASDRVLAYTPKEQKNVKVLKMPSLEYMSPDRLRPVDLADAPQNLDFRLSILPFTGDKHADIYLVIPTLGIITPIIVIPETSKDFERMSNGYEIDINSYLVNGVLHYAQTAMPGEEGNMVVFGHSNFYKNKPGNYKTIFADLMALDVWTSDELRIYQKQDSGTYRQLKYAIFDSYETSPDDVEILLPLGGKELTVFACTNGLEGRWIVRARQLEWQDLWVGTSMRVRMWDVMKRFKMLDLERQDEVRTQISQLIVEKKKRSLDGYTLQDKIVRNAWFSYIEKALGSVVAVAE